MAGAKFVQIFVLGGISYQIFALDDEGSVWRFNGKAWQPIPMERS